MDIDLMYIIGLPRSRTAWLSVFMSQSGTYFHHEGLNGCHSMDEYDKKTNGCGDSTTGFMPLLSRIKDSKTVIIKKNDSELADCIEWCNKAYKFNSEELILSLDAQLNNINGLIVNQSDIDKNLESIWSYLVDDKWYNRYANLKNLNIQVNSTSIDEEAAKALYESIQ